MTAIACLRVFVGEDLQWTNPEAMAALVAKVSGAYLEGSWVWPRRFGLVAPFSFVLADPRATQLNARELQALAKELQLKLFGQQGDGQISLMMYEGDQTDVLRFSSTPVNDLVALLDGRDDGFLTGRVCKITPDSVESLAPKGGSVEGSPSLAAHSNLDAERATPSTTWAPIYNLDHQRFIGGVVLWRESARAMEVVVEGQEAIKRDLACLAAAIEAMAKSPKGFIFLPLSFSSVIRPSVRELYLPYIERLPKPMRHRLAASIYGVPCEPFFGALSKIREFLDPWFSLIDLRITDPAFRIATVPLGVITSVTLAVERARLTAIEHFLADAGLYEHKEVWQGVTGIRDTHELDLCRQLNAPFLSGPAVSSLFEEPPGQFFYPAPNLPYRSWKSGREPGPQPGPFEPSPPAGAVVLIPPRDC
ncbi:MAG: hypothetical protein JWP92_1847 [Caulobacter sp.]|nr:hypothetical protein [Caulobacter sp.]